MSDIILITGAGTGMGRLTARTLAHAGHTVYATMRDTTKRNAHRVAEFEAYAKEHNIDLRTVELDVLSQESCDRAVSTILDAHGRLDVLIHNAAHLYYGITEAFTPEQILSSFDTNAVGTLRVNRAVLPVMRQQESGLLLWVGSGTSHLVPPFLSPYTAAKAAMDSFAESVAYEVARFGIETSIVMPGPFTEGTQHFPNAAQPRDKQVMTAYSRYENDIARNGEATEALFAPDVQAVADEIVRIVNLPPGKRPYRSSVDFSDFGDLPVFTVQMAMRDRLLNRMGFGDLLKPRGK